MGGPICREGENASVPRENDAPLSLCAVLFIRTISNPRQRRWKIELQCEGNSEKHADGRIDQGEVYPGREDPKKRSTGEAGEAGSVVRRWRGAEEMRLEPAKRGNCSPRAAGQNI